MKPIVGLNFKTYKEAAGKNALKLLKVIEKFNSNFSVKYLTANLNTFTIIEAG